MLEPSQPGVERYGSHGKEEMMHQGLGKQPLQGESKPKRHLIPQAGAALSLGCSHPVQRIQRSGHLHSEVILHDTPHELLRGWISHLFSAHGRQINGIQMSRHGAKRARQESVKVLVDGVPGRSIARILSASVTLWHLSESSRAGVCGRGRGPLARPFTASPKEKRCVLIHIIYCKLIANRQSEP